MFLFAPYFSFLFTLVFMDPTKFFLYLSSLVIIYFVFS